MSACQAIPWVKLMMPMYNNGMASMKSQLLFVDLAGCHHFNQPKSLTTLALANITFQKSFPDMGPLKKGINLKIRTLKRLAHHARSGKPKNTVDKICIDQKRIFFLLFIRTVKYSMPNETIACFQERPWMVLLSLSHTFESSLGQLSPFPPVRSPALTTVLYYLSKTSSDFQTVRECNKGNISTWSCNAETKKNLHFLLIYNPFPKMVLLVRWKKHPVSQFQKQSVGLAYFLYTIIYSKWNKNYSKTQHNILLV